MSARRWNRLTASAATGREEKPHLVAHVASEVYAVPLDRVREVAGIAELERSDDACGALMGVLSRSSEMWPVLDLSALVRGQRRTVPAYACGLVIDTSRAVVPHPVVLVVDSVSEVLSVAVDRMVTAPQVACGQGAPFVTAMVSLEHGLVPILDVDRVMACPDLRAACARVERLAGIEAAREQVRVP